MQAMGPVPNPIDKLFLKALVILLFGSLTVTRLKFQFVNVQSMPNYEMVFNFDTPLLICVFVVFICALLKMGSAIRVRNFWFFLAIPAFLAWLTISGIIDALKPEFFASALSQWFLAYLVFLAIPAILNPYGLFDYAIDVFLAWALFAGIAHLTVILFNPSQVLEGVSSVFSGNRAHVGVYFLISFATSVYAWMERKRRLHAVAAVVSILCLLTSGSRAAQLGAILFILLFILRSGSRKVTLWGIATIAGFGFFFKLIIADRAASSFAVSQNVSIDLSTGQRLIIWVKSWEIITQSQEHFFFGIGYTNFRFLFNKLVDVPIYANAAHDVYLHYWTETGLIGVSLFLIICGSMIAYCWKKRKAQPNLVYMGFLTVGLMVSGITQETFVPCLAMGNVLTLYFLVMGLVFYKALVKSETTAPDPLPGAGKHAAPHA